MLNVSCLALSAALTVACSPRIPQPDAPILLYSGTGTSPNDVEALRQLLRKQGLKFAEVSTSALNAMSDSDLVHHELFIAPGGDFLKMGDALLPSTTKALRNAVSGGMNYLGICAGAFLAGDAPYRSLNLTGGVRFGFYAISGTGVRKAIVPVTGPDGIVVEHYWEDGPQLNGWGAVIGKYADGSAAIVEGTLDKGVVILTGVHTEAPETWWRGLSSRGGATTSNAVAARLLEAALKRGVLPHF